MTGSGTARGGPQVIPRPASAVPGGAPPWARWIGREDGLGPDDVRAALSPRSVDAAMAKVVPGVRRSAVAVILSPGAADAGSPAGLEVVLTRRAWTMRTHRGEIAFPGGAEDATDDFPVGTALREADEEVGLPSDRTEVTGALDPLTTFTSDRVVLPVVLLTEARPELVLSPDEVDGILHVPLAALLHPDCYHEERWTWGDEMRGAGIGAVSDHPMHFFELIGDTVWGATAAMLHQLLTLLLGTDR